MRRLSQAGIARVEELLRLTPAELAGLLAFGETRSGAILEAARALATAAPSNESPGKVEGEISAAKEAGKKKSGKDKKKKKKTKSKLSGGKKSAKGSAKKKEERGRKKKKSKKKKKK